MADRPSFRVALSFAFAFATATAAYAWVRAIEALLLPRSDPRAIVIVTQSGFLVRCGIAAFVGGMGAFGGHALGADPRRGARALSIAVVLAAVALGAQAGLAP
ncbi:MAG: hypothetical protein U0441_33315 [Polyangiaceae bacterium]